MKNGNKSTSIFISVLFICLILGNSNIVYGSEPSPFEARPVVEAYMAAVERGDQDATFDLMTESCIKTQKTKKLSYNDAFFNMGVKVKKWIIGRADIRSKDKVSIRATTEFIDKDRGDPIRPIRFLLIPTDGEWRINKIY